MMSSACSTFSSWVKLLGSLNIAAYVKVSKTVRCGYNTSSCVTKPIFRLTELEKVWPQYVMLPESFPDSLPPRAANKVVFPLPDGPSMASNSPGRTTPLTPLRTVRVLFESAEVNKQRSFPDCKLIL
ncbi:hypothetical protein HanPSC8_Chr17g0794991 [Helianthus annuus]|nr:hypothetical protein HanPSC8_Chr17g0794991 [Helianthus annuus]